MRGNTNRHVEIIQTPQKKDLDDPTWSLNREPVSNWATVPPVMLLLILAEEIVILLAAQLCWQNVSKRDPVQWTPACLRFSIFGFTYWQFVLKNIWTHYSRKPYICCTFLKYISCRSWRLKMLFKYLKNSNAIYVPILYYYNRYFFWGGGGASICRCALFALILVPNFTVFLKFTYKQYNELLSLFGSWGQGVVSTVIQCPQCRQSQQWFHNTAWVDISGL